MRNETVRVLGREDSFYFSPEEICTVSMKHGAIAGMAFAAIVLLGVLSGGAYADTAAWSAAASALNATDAAGTAMGALDALAPDLPEKNAVGVQLASAAPDAALLAAAVQAVSLGQAPVLVPCNDLHLSFSVDKISGGPSAKFTFINTITTTSGLIPNIIEIRYYISGANATENTEGFIPTWPSQQSQPYNPTQGADQQKLEIGGENNNIFTKAGLYSVGIRVRMEDPDNPGTFVWCGNPLNNDIPVYVKDLLTITETDETPKADFTAEDKIVDTTSVPPSSSWMPLFEFTMSYGDPPAPRVLVALDFNITGDPHAGERSYPVLYEPREEDFYQFGLIADINADDEWRRYEEGVSEPSYVWDNHGAPYDYVKSIGDLSYSLTFGFDPNNPAFNADDPFNPGNPTIPFDQWLKASPDPGTKYFVVFRTSSVWRTYTGLAVMVTNARMHTYSGNTMGVFPIGDNGEKADSYSPDFYGSPREILYEETAYSSSFGVFDVTGGFDSREPNATVPPDPGQMYINNLNYPQTVYTPLAEHTRPRWDRGAGTIVLEGIMGEVMNFRQVTGTDDWKAVLGLDVHGPADDQPLVLNVICTDVGADPFGMPGNGGFDPRYGLEHFTTEAISCGNYAAHTDYAFNGVSLYHDTNHDGRFQAPTPQGMDGNTYGVTFTDFPMRPLIGDHSPSGYITQGLNEWEYIPFPPNGGDPWWKIQLVYDGGRRRCGTETPTGYFTPTPDPYMDYFVVLRTDSGHTDVSGITADGNGLKMGAETKVFIEPRRWDARDNHWEGGILLSNQIPASIDFPAGYELTHDTYYWQDAAIFNTYGSEISRTPLPWWPERTHNQDVVKPIRFNVEVHDLVLTYTSNNLYGKVTNILGYDNAPPFGNDIYSIITTLYALDGFTQWVDPFHFGAVQFIADLLTYDSINDNLLLIGTQAILTLQHVVGEHTSIQYAYESTPFRRHDTDQMLVGDFEFPASSFYPNPPEQPTLPDFTTWPLQDGYGPSIPPNPGNVVDFGLSCRVYVDPATTGDNQPFHIVTTSSSTETYRNDIYHVELADGSLSGSVAGMWFIDRLGAPYHIESSQGNSLVLSAGQVVPPDIDTSVGNTVDTYIWNGPFINDYPYDPSNAYTTPATAFSHGSWMIVRKTLRHNTYPRQSDWPDGLDATAFPGAPNPGLRAARLLKQRVEVNSLPTAMLGINLVGTNDPVVNRAGGIKLNSVTVAFWGPEFDPTDLAKLDSQTGILPSSGVMLYEDADQNGVFDMGDRIVPLEPTLLAWSSKPEPIDLDGDNIADDLSGDGVVVTDEDSYQNAAGDSAFDGLYDLAWVLQLKPRLNWPLPYVDARVSGSISLKGNLGLPSVDDLLDLGKTPEYWAEPHYLFTPSAGETKALTQSGSNAGDDLFVAICTSDSISTFEDFRCMIPVRLPSRATPVKQLAGVSVAEHEMDDGACRKFNAEEETLQDFYGHDMLEVNVPSKIIDLSPTLAISIPGLPQTVPVIVPGGPPVAVLGVDASANRPDNQIAKGTGASAVAAEGSFLPSKDDIQLLDEESSEYYSSGWTSKVVRCYLVTMGNNPNSNNADVLEGLRGFEITGVSGNALTLRSGMPEAGNPWYIIKDPTFLEQVIVEMYDVSSAAIGASFNPHTDLLPLGVEDPARNTVSGISIYRDNDADPRNTNGVFDPPMLGEDDSVTYIDYPVEMDDVPAWLLSPGEPNYQVKFVFSSPGTDNSTGRDVVPYETQPLLRQWVPQSFGASPEDPEYGPDFFVVVRASGDMNIADSFMAAICSWGPNTPTEPDPDTFSNIYGTTQQRDEFDIYSEFPGCSRALGFITMFRDPIPVRYWSYDPVLQKQIPITEIDRSQDMMPVQRWVRSNANVVNINALPIVATAKTKVDFVGTPTRQIVGGDVVFTIQTSVANIMKYKWDFGDGSTSSDPNPTHTYEALGKYTVTLTVTDVYGVETTKEKANYIEIMEAPFADFTGDPLDASMAPDPMGDLPPGLNVQFTNSSIGSDRYAASKYFWDFGDLESATPPDEATERDPLHRYTKAGVYTVKMTVFFQDMEADDDTYITRKLERQGYVTVRPCVGCEAVEGSQDGEAQEVPTVNFTVETAIRDKEALMPLSDYVPLIHFTMNYDPENPADRILKNMTLYLHPDDRDPLNELHYGNMGGPRKEDILEFGLFIETEKSESKYNKLLDPADFLMYSWDSNGKCLFHYYDSTKVGTKIGTLQSESMLGDLLYTLDFLGTNGATLMTADFPVPAGPANDALGGNSYILAVRTSAYWRAQTTMGCDVLDAVMIKPDTGNFPVTAENAPVDTYAPNFYADTPETLEPKVAYSASFAVWDTSGSYIGESAAASNATRVPDEVLPFYDTWDRPLFLYTPLAEYTRPRWGKSTDLMDMMAGEFLGMRKLLGQDEWRDVIGINVHSTRPFYSDTDGMAQLREVNLVVTDIGADPFGAPGNGGLNPNDGFENVTTQLSINFQPDAKDITFNGAWVWYDGNHNGIFDKPAVDDAGNVTLDVNGDLPLYPDYMDDLSDLNPLDPPTGVDLKWEYIPLPPGGGDPWWKINLRFASGARRPWGDLDSKKGYVEALPNNYLVVPSGSQVSSDYFVVIRTDSGFMDVSRTVPDGVGIQMGADFRAFIEPRHINSIGKQDGGIFVDSMIPDLGSRDGLSGDPWQEDPNWDNEPWWPQRTVNEKSSKPFKVGVDIHDLVLVYTTDSTNNISSDIFFGMGSYWEYGCMGFAYTDEGFSTDFEQWMDPFMLDRGKFFYGQSVGVTRWRTQGRLSFTVGGCGCFGGADTVNLSYNQIGTRGTYSYETVPFEHGVVPGMDSRSSAYKTLPPQPTLPDLYGDSMYLAQWPVFGVNTGLAMGEYPRASDWDAAPTQAQRVNARMLAQKVDTMSSQTPMLGINLAATSDPVVLAGHERMSIARLTVAFWGPDFKPADLSDLDPQGLDYDSGVMLWQDSDHNGTFFEAKPLAAYWDLLADVTGFDTPIAVRDLNWGDKPEPVDLDGDGAADDMNGDGVVDSRDYAWVLTFYPENQWYLPNADGSIIKGSYSWEFESCPALGGTDEKKSDDAEKSEKDFDVSAGSASSDDKQTEGATEDTTVTTVDIDPGDDLFITVKTAENAKRFSSFRAVVPATLPGRSGDLKKAGIQFFPQVNSSSSAFVKSSPEEEPVQDFYGHDMLQFNVPLRLLDMTNQNQQLTIAGAALPVMGFDASTNRGNAGEAASGAAGAGQDGMFAVQGAAWAVNQFAGDYLVDSRYETYEILSNTADTLTLRSGTPRNGRWRIVTDPTFLEQVVIELYNEGEDADFNPLFDLLPLSKDQELSGVALYRDNDSNPNNRNGLFDPGIDIPLALDGAPCFIGQTGENTQVRFIFSTPGTDDVPLPMAEQTRNRQWVPDRWGVNSNDEFFGADFFVVVRASENMQDGDNFRIGMVNWGPNTPTEPDPDTWANIVGEERNDATKFEEFPWAIRGLGFITFFKDAQPYYFMDGANAKVRADGSGFNWLRSHTSKKRETGVIMAKKRVLTPISVIIESASATQLPSQTLDNKGFTLVIYGKNFGANPSVTITGYNVEIDSATDTAIKVTLTTIPDAPPQEPIVLIVRNTNSGETASRSNLFTLTPGNPADKPRVDGVNPGRGAQNDFPVTVVGANFAAMGSVEVLFGTTTMPVQGVNAAGTAITVAYPLGGLPIAGPLNVTVRNLQTGTEDILIGGFNFVSDPVPPKLIALFGCSEGAGVPSGALGDLLVVLVFGLGLCAVKRAGDSRRARAGRNE